MERGSACLEALGQSDYPPLDVAYSADLEYDLTGIETGRFTAAVVLCKHFGKLLGIEPEISENNRANLEMSPAIPTLPRHDENPLSAFILPTEIDSEKVLSIDHHFWGIKASIDRIMTKTFGQA